MYYIYLHIYTTSILDLIIALWKGTTVGLLLLTCLVMLQCVDNSDSPSIVEEL